MGFNKLVSGLVQSSYIITGLTLFALLQAGTKTYLLAGVSNKVAMFPFEMTTSTLFETSSPKK